MSRNELVLKQLQERLSKISESKISDFSEIESLFSKVFEENPTSPDNEASAYAFLSAIQQQVDSEDGKKQIVEIVDKVQSFNEEIADKNLLEEERLQFLLKKATAWLKDEEAESEARLKEAQISRINSAVKDSIQAALRDAGINPSKNK